MSNSKIALNVAAWRARNAGRIHGAATALESAASAARQQGRTLPSNAREAICLAPTRPLHPNRR